MPETHMQVVEFGKFVLDLNRGTLRASGEDINLRPQAFEVLSILATRSGELVSKDELISVVWGGTPVTDGSLTQCIVEIRKAIGDNSRTIIRTVPKRGFIFEPSEAKLMDSPTGRAASLDNRRGGWRKSWIAGTTVAVVASLVIIGLLSTTDDGGGPVVDDPSTGTSPNSVAVLPFVDMSQGQDQQYFGDGIAEEILARLGEYPDLVVIARTSSFLFRERKVDVAAIGRDLHSAYVLEGSIRKSGSRLRITAQLNETQGGTHIWSDSYDEELTVENMLDIQAAVAASVAESIAKGALPAKRKRDPVHEAANTDAYDFYLEGMFYLQQIRMADRQVYDGSVYDAALERFEASIEYDHDWAPPHVALGRTLLLRAGMYDDSGDSEAVDWYRLAKRHLLEAIRLDRDNGLAYSSLGHVLYHLDFDFPAAEAAYARARELGDYVPWSYAIFLRGMGRFEEAIEEYQLAIERDPLSAGPRHQLATTYRCIGRYADSIAELEKVLRLAPTRDDLYVPLTYLYLKTGNVPYGRELFERINDPESTTIALGAIYVLLGMTDKAHEALAQVEASRRWSVEEYVATALALGDQERALNYLEAAYSDDPRKLSHVVCIDGIRSLAGNARFEQLLRTAGFPGHTL
jgi:TolB-like protein/DNA-binding winged helix-turn-helix (wHTH) protein/Flp pilus assembly protein TadD